MSLASSLHLVLLPPSQTDLIKFLFIFNQTFDLSLGVHPVSGFYVLQDLVVLKISCALASSVLNYPVKPFLGHVCYHIPPSLCMSLHFAACGILVEYPNFALNFYISDSTALFPSTDEVRMRYLPVKSSVEESYSCWGARVACNSGKLVVLAGLVPVLNQEDRKAELTLKQIQINVYLFEGTTETKADGVLTAVLASW
ncbi:hypothetical protein B0H10DRAFT_1948848 [Mycena sp. CBHHK59/15]|nr:hypothetical protein B0H10DRAFT_1948848 [Mycena sp. CBHHK59/15]